MGRVQVTDPYSGATITVKDDSPQAKLWGESSRRITAEPIVEQDESEAVVPADELDDAAEEVPAEQDEVAEVAEVEAPRGNASLEDWANYAISKGVAGETLDGLKRDEIKQLVAE